MELTFEQFWRGHFCVDPDSHEDKILWLHEACMDIGGGKISIPEIDVLAEHPEVEAVAISGLRQDTFDASSGPTGSVFGLSSFSRTNWWRTGPCSGPCQSWNTSIGSPTSGSTGFGI